MRFDTRSVLRLVVVALALAITSSAWADVMTGRITAVNPTASTFTMETSTGTTTYYTDKNTKFVSGDRHVELASLKIGDRVSIQADKVVENAVVSRVSNVEILPSDNLTAENRPVLPRTASPLPLLGLYGVILVGAALAIRVGLRSLH